jgi:hypothetical protein
MDSKGHRIFFSIDNKPGYIEIKRSGWASFEYACVLNDVLLKENTQTVQSAVGQPDLSFKVSVDSFMFTEDEAEPGQKVAWYVVSSQRSTDGVSTKVHRYEQ